MAKFLFVVIYGKKGKKIKPFLKVYNNFKDFENDSVYKAPLTRVIGLFPVKENEVESAVELCKEYIEGRITFISLEKSIGKEKN